MVNSLLDRIYEFNETLNPDSPDSEVLSGIRSIIKNLIPNYEIEYESLQDVIENEVMPEISGVFGPITTAEIVTSWFTPIETNKIVAKFETTDSLVESKCGWNNGESLVNSLRNQIYDFNATLSEDSTDEEVIKGLKRIIKEMLPNYEIDYDSLADIIQEGLMADINALGLSVSADTIASWFVPIETGKVDSKFETTDSLVEHKTEEDELRDKYSKDYIYKHFGNDTMAIDLFNMVGTRHAVEMLTVNGRGGQLKSSLEFSQSVYNRQQGLFNNIIKHLRSEADSYGLDRHLQLLKVNKDHKNKFAELIASNNPELNVESWELIKRYFGPTINNYTTNNVDKAVANIVSQNILGKEVNASTVQESRSFFNALSSYVILNNFDSYITDHLGKIVNIDKSVPLFAEGRYKLGDKSNNLGSHFDSSDEIDIFKSTNALVQKFVSDFKMVDSNKNILPFRNMHFREFSYVVAKLKRQAYSKEFNDKSSYYYAVEKFAAIANSAELQNDPVYQKALKTLKQSESLADLIDKTRINPEDGFRAVFTLLYHTDLANSTMTGYDMRYIYTIAANAYIKQKSLDRLSFASGRDGLNFMSYLAQSMDTVQAADYGQYFQNADGDVGYRDIRDLSQYNAERAIKDKIQLRNNKNAILWKEEFEEPYQVKFKDSSNSKFKTFEIEFTVGDTTYNYSLNRHAFTTKKFEVNAQNREALEKFIGTVLRENISSKDFQQSWAEVTNGTVGSRSMYSDLFKLSTDILAHMAYENNLLKDYKSVGQIMNDSNVFLLEGMHITTRAGDAGIELISNKVGEAITNLAKVQNLRNGTMVSSQIATSEGTTVGAQTLNKLGGAARSQWAVNERNTDSPSNHFVMLNLIDGPIEQAKELKIGDIHKAHTKLTNKEIETAMFLYDYYEALDSDIMRFIPATLSDKSFIGRLPVRMKTEIPYTIKEVIDESEFLDWVMQKGDTTITMDILNSTKDEVAAKAEEYASKGLFTPTRVSRLVAGDLSEKRVTLQEILKHPESERLLVDLIQDQFSRFYNKIEDKINQDWHRILSLFNDLQLVANVLNTNVDEDLAEALSALSLAEGEHYKMGHGMLNVTFDNIAGYVNNPRIKGAKSLVAEMVRHYNHQNPTKPIKLINEVHFSGKGETLSHNLTLESLINRFNSAEATKHYFDGQHKVMVRDLLKDGFDFDLDAVANIRKNNVNWIDSDTQLGIFAKVNIGGIQYNITNNEIPLSDRIQLINSGSYKGDSWSDYIIDLPNSDIEVNPNLVKYNLLDYLSTQQYVNITAGAHYTHPAKVNKDELDIDTRFGISYLLEEGSKGVVQSKRLSAITATTEQFTMNLLSGSVTNVRSVILGDTSDVVYNLLGELGRQNSHDGSTFVSSNQVRAENNSLGGARSGLIKKPYYHDIMYQYGAGFNGKTAGFGMSNDLARNSFHAQHMMELMMKVKWYDSNGVTLNNYNILDTYDFASGSHSINDRVYRDSGAVNWDNNALYAFRNENGDIVKVLGLEYAGDNSYKVTYQLNNDEGVATSEVGTYTVTDVNTNYDLWHLFGGYNSVTFDGNEYVNSEASLDLLFAASTKTGFPTVEGQINSKDDFYQPLLHSENSYVFTEGAVKNGISNRNSADWLDTSTVIDKNAPSADFFYFNMTMAGIQLDKEHNSDSGHLSLTTQVLSAISARGYTYDLSSEAYEALALLGENNIGDMLSEFENFAAGKTTPDAFRTMVLDVIVESILNEKDSNNALQDSIRKKLEKLAANGNLNAETASAVIPFSDPGLINTLSSKLSIFVNRNVISPKLNGSLMILAPAHKFMRLHGNRMLSEYRGSKAALEQAQQEQPIINHSSKLRINRTYNAVYQDGRTEKITIKVPGLSKGDTHGYLTVKNMLDSGDIVSMQEDIIEGRDLAHYNLTFETGLGTLQLYDIASIQKAFELEAQEASKEEKALNQRQIQRDLQAIKEGGHVDVIVINKDGEAKINKVEVNGTLQEEPYEAVLPKMFKSDYNLRANDSLQDILNKGPQFFKDRMLGKLQNRISSDYLVELKFMDGNHFYVNSVEDIPESQSSEMYRDNDVKIHTYLDGTTWRLDESGNKMYQMFSPKDQVWIKTENGVTTEVIYSEAPLAYTKYMQGYSALVVNGMDSNILTALNQMSVHPDWENASLSKVIRDYQQTYGKDFINSAELIEDNNRLLHSTDYGSLPISLQRTIDKTSEKTFISFNKSLQTVASRTPAQSMQSFMAMRIAGFNESDNNTAYVSTVQLWLQGSDFDIDTTNFTTYSINRRGQVEHWSDIADWSSVEMFRASDYLPIPNGRRADYILNTGETSGLDVSALFNEQGELQIDTPAKMRLLAKALKTVKSYTKNIDGEEVVNIGVLEGIRQEGLDDLIKLFDKHNFSLVKKTRKDRENALKNFLVSTIYNVIVDPINQVSAQQPIDSVTKPVNRLANSPDNEVVKDSKWNTPGSVTTKSHGLVTNHEGKGGLEIAAVGLKMFFGWTNYVNTVLNDPKASSKDLSRLIMGKDGEGITINGKTYLHIANAYKLGEDIFNTISTEEAIELLAQVHATRDEQTKKELLTKVITSGNQDYDAAILLSILRSQAENNATELSLAKLNAGTDTMGMYIFGASLGVPIEELVAIMQSPSAKELSRIVKGNIFKAEKDGRIANKIVSLTDDINTQIYHFAKKGNKVHVQARGVYEIYTYFKRANQEAVDRLLEILGLEKISDLGAWVENRVKQGQDIESDTQIQAYKQLLSTAMFEDFRLKYAHSQLLNKLIKHAKTVKLIKYTKTVDKLHPEGYNYYDDLVTLSKGAKQILEIAGLLRANKGVSTQLIERQLYLDKLTKGSGLSAIDYAVNSQELVNKFEQYSKFIVNTPDLLRKNKHYDMYVKAHVLVEYSIAQLSSKYRGLQHFKPIADKELGYDPQDPKGISRIGRIMRMIDDFMITTWLNSPRFRNGTGRVGYYSIAISESESKMIYPNKQKHSKTEISQIGTVEGREAFARWVEKVMLPNLQCGYNGSLDNDTIIKNSTIANNLIIRNLHPMYFDRASSNKSYSALALPINMSPRSLQGKAIFREFKNEFTKLRNLNNYNLFYFDIDGEPHLISDVLFVYNLAVHLNKPGQSTLTNIFTDLIDSGLIEDYYKFVSEFDRNLDVTENLISKEFFLSHVRPIVSSERTTSSKQAWLKDKANSARLYHTNQYDDSLFT